MRVRPLFFWFRYASPFIKVSCGLSPRVPRRFASPLSAAQRLIFLPTALWLLFGWLIACILIFDFIACGGHGQNL